MQSNGNNESKSKLDIIQIIKKFVKSLEVEEADAISSSNSSVANSSKNPSPAHTITPDELMRNYAGKLVGLCRVCNDIANGVHYGVVSCEACKAFYRRSLISQTKYACPLQGKCQIGPDNRNYCQYCRFQKCEQEGMSLFGSKMGRIPKSAANSPTNKRNFFRPYTIPNNARPAASHSPFIDINKLIQDLNLTNLKNQNDSSSLFSILLASDKCYQSFIESTNERLTVLQDRALSSILKKNDNNLPIKEIWPYVLESLSSLVKNFISFAKNVPGFEKIDDIKLKTILFQNLFNYFVTTHAYLFIDDDCYIILSDKSLNNQIQMNKELIKKMCGVELTEKLFDFTSDFNELKFTLKEISNLIPYLMTSSLIPDKMKDTNTIGANFDTNLLQNLNEFYQTILFYQFDLNKRDSQFIGKYESALRKLSNLNNMVDENLKNHETASFESLQQE